MWLRANSRHCGARCLSTMPSCACVQRLCVAERWHGWGTSRPNAASLARAPTAGRDVVFVVLDDLSWLLLGWNNDASGA